MKKKKRNKNLINILSFLNEATIELKNKIENLLKNKLDLRKLEELYDAISSLKEGEITQELLLLLNSKSEEIYKILDTKKIRLIPYYKDKKEKFAQIKQKFDFLLNAAKDAAEHQKTIAQEAEKRKPFDDYYRKMLSAYETFSLNQADLYNTEKGEDFVKDLYKERAYFVSDEAFKNFLSNIKDSRVLNDFTNNKQDGEVYQDYLQNYIKTRKSIVDKEVNDQLKKLSIPEIQPTRQIPVMQQLPQEEPPTSPTSIFGQIGSGFKKGFQGFKTAIGLEEEVLKQESLQESLKLKKLSLKEAMEKEYD